VGIYGGIDNGAAPGGPFANSSAAQSAFWAAIGASSPTVTFEGVASLSDLGAGVSAVLTDADASSGLQTTDQHTPEALGFNITSGGNEWLKVAPQFNSATGATVTFNFSSAVQGFGVWFTDTQSNFPGPITIAFDDGTAESLSVTKNGADVSGAFSGGAVFLGFTTDAGFSSVSINTGATDNTRDVWGLDDITMGPPAVPEPGSILLLGTGLAGIAGMIRRKLLP